MILLKTVAILAAMVAAAKAEHLRGLGSSSDDGSQQKDKKPCDSKNYFTNAGSGGSLTNIERTQTSKRKITEENIDVSMALDTFDKVEYYSVGRILKSGSTYKFEDESYKNSCYDYDVVIGFAELDEDYCKAINPKKRIFSVKVKGVEGIEVEGGTTEIVTDLDVVNETGDCFKAYTVKKSITLKAKTIRIQFTKPKGKESDGDPMVSFISIHRQPTRRLGASNCD